MDSEKRARGEGYDETLCAEHVQQSEAPCLEALIAGFLQKKMQKELRRSGHPTALQEKIDDAKVTEFIHTLLQEKRAIEIIPPQQAKHIRRTRGHRIMSNRFVITMKQEDNVSRTKARWCQEGGTMIRI